MREGLHKVVPSDDTIVASATAMGRSAIGVVRLSGKHAVSIASHFLKSAPLVPRHAVVGFWVDDKGTAIDEVVATLFQSPHSYTGEDVVEISAHGNPLILNRIVGMMQEAGARQAVPGEFTLRAVLNGKLDLIQAEAVRDFISAQTEAQARSALRQMGGALSGQLAPGKDRLLDIIAHLEAGIDFADDDVAPPGGSKVAEQLTSVLMEFEKLQESYSYGRLLSMGLRLAIVGKPNVGKSSLFNRLVGSDCAIVSEVPGTTRDVLRESISLDGVPLQFLDTAGMHETADPVERIGVERSLASMCEADLVLVVLDGAAGLDEDDRQILSRVEGTRHLTIVNKCDLPQVLEEAKLGSSTPIRVSAKTGEGFSALQSALGDFLGTRSGGTTDPMVTSARQFEAISKAVQAIEKARVAALEETPHEMLLLDLYAALAELDELTGEVVTEDILGRIFSSFCIGK